MPKPALSRSLLPLLGCLAALLLALYGAAFAVAAKPAPKAKAHAPHCTSRARLLGQAFDRTEPAPLATPLDPTVLAQYAVLRRAAVSEDALPPLSSLGGALDGTLASYYPAYIRRVVALPNGGRYFLITGFDQTLTVPPAPCLPKALRKARPRLVALDRRLAVEPVYCIGVVGELTATNEGITCQRYSTVASGAGLAEGAFSFGQGLKQPKVELAPDGVVSVRLHYPDAAPITASVSENAYMFTPPVPSLERLKKAFKEFEAKHRHEHKSKRSEAREGIEGLKLLERFASEQLPKVEWLGGEGQLIRSFTPVHEVSLLETLLLPTLSSSSSSSSSSGLLRAG
jgi:hypothetical protein